MDPYRLPRSVIPARYEIRLVPDLDTARFTGGEVISVTVAEPVETFVLNAAELTIHRASLELESGNTLEPSVSLDAETERCLLTFDQKVPQGNHRLRLSFEGTLNDKLRGFYRSRYRLPGGEDRWMAATQFEATDARRAFPCWDEPSFKAVFSCTLVVPAGVTALSCTAVASEEVQENHKVIRFADTIPLPTYLVAFIVGELEATEPELVGKTPLRVWCVPGKLPLARFARDIAAFSLKFFEDYFGINYPGDKLDLAAIPDFAAGAMENFGLITFRETALLVDPETATLAEQERVADVVAHENAHMWFGDLVTMSWWNGLWLKEAFATFMEMMAVDAWKPRWRRWDAFGVSRSAALLVDGLQSTRSVEFTVQAPHDAEAMFDVLTYEKGCSVLRMLEQYLGPDLFRTGVYLYLERHAYGNTDTADLWTALGEAAREPIPAVMDGWIFQPGYPLLTAELEGEGTLVLRQRRFTYLPPTSGDQADQIARQQWKVPVQVRFIGKGEAQHERLLLGADPARLPLPEGFQAALINEGGHGFYRVHYTPSLLLDLLNQVAGGRLSPIERFNLVNDSWALVLAGLMSLTDDLDLTSHFKGERDKNVWAILSSSFHALNRIIADEDRPGLAALVRDRASQAAAHLGWSPQAGEDEPTGQLRGDLLRLLGTLGEDGPTQSKAAEVHAAALKEPASVPASVASAAVAILAHTGDDASYEDFLSRYRAGRTPQEEQRYLYALTGFRADHLVQRTLDLTLGGPVRTQDAPFVVRSLLMSPHGRARAWAFFKHNWEQMKKEYPVPGFRRMCEGVIGLATPEREQDVHAFFQTTGLDLGGKILAQYLEQLRIAVALRVREGGALHDYLQRQRKYPSPPARGE
jgi:puromycin-sensitive aminopeptidase